MNDEQRTNYERQRKTGQHLSQKQTIHEHLMFGCYQTKLLNFIQQNRFVNKLNLTCTEMYIKNTSVALYDKTKTRIDGQTDFLLKKLDK